MGSKNNPGVYDCYDKAHPDEPMFILLGRDPFGASLVRLWAAAREARNPEDTKLQEARTCSDAMRAWCTVEAQRGVLDALDFLPLGMLVEAVQRRSASLAEDVWLPITTAPQQQWLRTRREGEPGENVCACKMLDDVLEWFDREGRTTVTHSTFLPPTHWRPLSPLTSRAGEPLRADVVNDALVASIGVDTLAFAAKHADYPLYVLDPHLFAAAVAAELCGDEDEKGNSAFARALDRACVRAAESGLDCVAFPLPGEPG